MRERKREEEREGRNVGIQYLFVTSYCWVVLTASGTRSIRIVVWILNCSGIYLLYIYIYISTTTLWTLNTYVWTMYMAIQNKYRECFCQSVCLIDD